MNTIPATASDYARYDAALDRLAAMGPSLANGLVNHAPMVVEALAAMGRGTRIPAFLDRYAAELAPRAEAQPALTDAELDAALGDRGRYEAWRAWFEERIHLDGWNATLERWCARLAPGFVTAAAHGVLRTAHAARALGVADNGQRRSELAEGLALWASGYHTLAVALAPRRGDLAPGDALEAVDSVPLDKRPGPGLIVAGYASIAHCTDFPGQVARADLSGPFSGAVDAAVRAFAAGFDRHASTAFEAIALTHAVTGTAAVGHLGEHLTDATRGLLLDHAWAGGCALFAAFGHGVAPAVREPQDAEDLADRAARHGDDHVIKLTEACISAWRRSGDPVLLAVAGRIQALLPAA